MISPENVRTLFYYCSITGVLFWRETGERAGSVQSNGYRVVRHKKKAYQEHRIIWLYVQGEWPSEYIDHINGNKIDNRLINLRAATHQQNLWNAGTKKRNGGLKGAYWQRGRWKATITKDRQVKYLGVFETEQEAHAAYLQAASELYGEYARHQ